MKAEADKLRLHYKGYQLMRFAYFLIAKWYYQHIVIFSTLLLLFCFHNHPWWGLVCLPLLGIPYLLGRWGQKVMFQSGFFVTIKGFNQSAKYQELYPDYAESLRLFNQESRLREVGNKVSPVVKTKKKI